MRKHAVSAVVIGLVLGLLALVVWQGRTAAASQRTHAAEVRAQLESHSGAYSPTPGTVRALATLRYDRQSGICTVAFVTDTMSGKGATVWHEAALTPAELFAALNEAEAFTVTEKAQSH